MFARLLSSLSIYCLFVKSFLCQIIMMRNFEDPTIFHLCALNKFSKNSVLNVKSTFCPKCTNSARYINILKFCSIKCKKCFLPLKHKLCSLHLYFVIIMLCQIIMMRNFEDHTIIRFMCPK